MRRRVQRLLDARLDLAAAVVGGRQPLLGAAALLAGVGQRLDRGRRQPVEHRLPGLGLLQAVGDVLARRRRRFDSSDSSARRRASISSGASASASRSATASSRRSASDGDVALGVAGARATQVWRSPSMASQPTLARGGLALQPLMHGARIGKRGAVARDDRLRRLVERCAAGR